MHLLWSKFFFQDKSAESYKQRFMDCESLLPVCTWFYSKSFLLDFVFKLFIPNLHFCKVFFRPFLVFSLNLANKVILNQITSKFCLFSRHWTDIFKEITYQLRNNYNFILKVAQKLRLQIFSLSWPPSLVYSFT